MDWVAVMKVGYFVLWIWGKSIAITALSRVFLLNNSCKELLLSALKTLGFIFYFK
jgi:hypothetical protein